MHLYYFSSTNSQQFINIIKINMNFTFSITFTYESPYTDRNIDIVNGEINILFYIEMKEKL